MSDMSSSTNTASALSHSESQTDILTERQSSLMCVSSFSPVQPSNTEELRMWLVEAFTASPSQSPDQSEEKMTAEICGLQQPTLFASSDLPVFSWKMCRDYLASTTVKAYSLTLPRWGMWDATGLYPQQMPELGTGVKDCGLWLTPRASDTGRGEGQETFLKRMGDRSDKCAQSLPSQVLDRKTWPSPTCSDVCTGNLKSTQQKPGSMHSVTLPQAVAMWPRPTSHLAKETGAPSEYNRNEPSITSRVFESPEHRQGMALNPQWVCWLMGWPIGWADVKPMAELDWRGWSVDPADIGEVLRVTDVKENRANQLKALGNGQVPQCVVKAWELLA